MGARLEKEEILVLLGSYLQESGTPGGFFNQGHCVRASRSHDAKTSGHLYFWKTENCFMWGGLSKAVFIYWKAWRVCTTRKTHRQHQKEGMCWYNVGFPVWEIPIDLLGSFQNQIQETSMRTAFQDIHCFSNIEAKTIASHGIHFQILRAMMESLTQNNSLTVSFTGKCWMSIMRCWHHFTPR